MRGVAERRPEKEMETYREPEEEDEERRRQRKLEEALEVKSLRRIISAYLNYPDAADEDVKRMERSYRKLPSAHKALLSHYPRKFHQLRQCCITSDIQIECLPELFSNLGFLAINKCTFGSVRCIAANSYFIFSMLQAFEPPLDMSQDTDITEHEHHDIPNDHHFSSERDIYSSRIVSTSGKVCSSECTEPVHREGSNSTHNLTERAISFKEETRGIHVPEPGNSPLESVSSIERCRHDINEVPDSNGNVPSSPSNWLCPSMQLDVPLVDVDKVRCIIRNIVRDWAAEGKKERDECYLPILRELDALFPNRSEESPPACLVPGAGLGRLALEISSMGFICQGNEFSYYMMICSNFILNHTQTAGEWTIYPWIHSNCNSFSESDQLRPASIPDIQPASAGITEGFSMCGGDFVEVYSEPSQVGAWDAVVTCFFIDTAHNIIEYIEIISKILKDGGVWINLGPLLYHFADMHGQEDEMSIELSLEDVKRVALHYGFELEKERIIETTYTTNLKSMMQNRYFAAFWTMRKKPAKKQHPASS